VIAAAIGLGGYLAVDGDSAFDAPSNPAESSPADTSPAESSPAATSPAAAADPHHPAPAGATADTATEESATTRSPSADAPPSRGAPAQPREPVEARPTRRDRLSLPAPAPDDPTAVAAHERTSDGETTESAAAPSSEAALLLAARRQLASDPQRVLASLETHRRHYPDGLLVEEREVLGIEALVRLDRRTDAADALSRLEARFPRSPHLVRLRVLAAAPRE
jgi:hypothetical protein